ncbi:uncharacterized protein LOC103860217 [Brassica rapa]|uniref:uncharacterized protein LOC103860217 n=1 Tax=Brassica campestris TaxID=3711 RepID=UPI00142E14BA|nr:uncharacterized protein LOC103860217 [Brassica rapa]
MVSKSQSAFLPGRLLAENVLLATDLVHGYNTQNISSRGMLKVDLRKAFDCVRWDFILASLWALAIPESYIRLVSECLSTTSFSVSINGALGGFFNSSKGIRQGDPMHYRYHPRTENVAISHLMFADDVMIFFDGSSNSLHGIAECLDDFASWSGLSMNATKTELFTAGLDQTESSALMGYGFPSGSFPIRYLGLPLMSRKLKISEYVPLMTKITKCFQAWSVKLLSFAGRLQLLKTVIFGIINFWFSAFMLPKGCIKNIESLCCRFLWSGNVDKRGIAKSPSLWAVWHRSIHLSTQSFWAIEPVQADSWAWKRLLKLRTLAIRFCKSVLGNGRTTSFWFDAWTPLGQLITYLGPLGPRALRVRNEAVVADVARDSTWSLPHPRSQQEVDLHSHLTTITLPLSHDIDDEYEWIVGDSPSNVFRAFTTWEALRPKQEIQDWHDVVWFKGSIPKHAFTMWTANYDRLPTKARLTSWGLPLSPLCSFCSREPEMREHLFLSCEYSLDVWSYVFSRCHPPTSPLTDWAELLSWIQVPNSKRLSLLRKLATQTVVFHLWKQRNNLIHNQISFPAIAVFRSIDKELRNVISARRKYKKFRDLMAIWLR